MNAVNQLSEIAKFWTNDLHCAARDPDQADFDLRVLIKAFHAMKEVAIGQHRNNCDHSYIVDCMKIIDDTFTGLMK